MDPLTILTAFIPVIQHGAKAAINKLSGGAGTKPATVEEAVKLAEIDIRRMEAIAKLDAVEGVAQWVANIRGLQRPVAVVVVLLSYIVTFSPEVPAAIHESVTQLAGAVIFYLFGDRSFMYMRKGAA
jgi:hypothetical protein